MHTTQSSPVLGTTFVVRDWLVPAVWVGKSLFVTHTFIPVFSNQNSILVKVDMCCWK